MNSHGKCNRNMKVSSTKCGFRAVAMPRSQAMIRSVVSLTGLLFFLTGVQSCTSLTSHSDVGGSPIAVSITTSEFKVTDKAIKWRYRITNHSQKDLWLCEGIVLEEYNFEVNFDEKMQTLLVRRRTDVPPDGEMEFPPLVGYVHVRPGESWTESLSLHLPIRGRSALTHLFTPESAIYAKCLALEIGFHMGDLPQMALDACTEADEARPRREGFEASPQSVLSFMMLNEFIGCRDERVVFRYGRVALKGGQVLRLEIGNQSIPYIGSAWDGRSLPKYPNSDACDRVAIHFAPSMLDYFFPYVRERDLMSATEQAYLRSQTTASVVDPKRVSTLAAMIGEADLGGIVHEGATARIICYRGDMQIRSFILYGDKDLETADGERFHYPLDTLDLSQVVAQIQPYEIRVKCARNLKNLWHRLQRYHQVGTFPSRESSHQGDDVTYPMASEWCDSLLHAYRKAAARYLVLRPYTCLGAGEGESHYAMNPNCRPDSSPDMVLLFETKAGWNQHGGPELFAFDNQDPKGGLVLLNDGTVKFIRTEEELNQLRWK